MFVCGCVGESCCMVECWKNDAGCEQTHSGPACGSPAGRGRVEFEAEPKLVGPPRERRHRQRRLFQVDLQQPNRWWIRRLVRRRCAEICGSKAAAAFALLSYSTAAECCTHSKPHLVLDCRGLLVLMSRHRPRRLPKAVAGDRRLRKLRGGGGRVRAQGGRLRHSGVRDCCQYPRAACDC